MTASTARKVVLVTGGGDLDPVELTGAFRAGLASSALRDRPVLALRWDGSALTGAGGPSAGVVIRETHAPDGSVETTVLALDHPCLSCAIREDLVVALEETGARYPGSHVVVLLPPGADTAGARSALKLAGGALDAVHAATTSVLHRPMLLADVGVDSTLIERGWQLMPGDDTGVADALLRQIESADTLLLIGKAGDAPVEQALLGWLAPDATWLSCLSLAHVPGTLAAFTVPSAPAEPGWLRLLQTHDAELGERGHLVLHDRGVGCLLWRARGPVHPQRLHDAMPALMDGCLRSRGHIWLPARPDKCVSWDHAGIGLRLRHDYSWVAADGPERWLGLSAQQRGWLDAHWHPRYGDRFQELVLLGVDHCDGPPARHLVSLLEECLLDDDDPTAPLDWAGALEDPFTDHLSR